MNITLLISILSIIMCILFIIGTFVAASDPDVDGVSFSKGWILGVLIITFLMIALYFMDIYNNDSKPDAIDVYRGKTELVISYEEVDTVRIVKDSTVIWK